MTNLLSGRHKYLTNKNTKKGQKVRKKLSLRERSHFLPLKTGTAGFKSCPKPFFWNDIFFLHSVSANLMIAKKRGNARKTPEIVRFRGFEAMISFLASLYGSGTRILNLESRVCWCETFCYCLRDSLQALTGLSRFEFTCVVSQNNKSIRWMLFLFCIVPPKKISWNYSLWWIYLMG